MAIVLQRLLMGVALVAAEDLIPAIARQNGAMACGGGELRAGIGGQGGGIAKRRIKGADDSRQVLHHLLGGEVVL